MVIAMTLIFSYIPALPKDEALENEEFIQSTTDVKHLEEVADVVKKKPAGKKKTRKKK